MRGGMSISTSAPLLVPGDVAPRLSGQRSDVCWDRGERELQVRGDVLAQLRDELVLIDTAKGQLDRDVIREHGAESIDRHAT